MRRNGSTIGKTLEDLQDEKARLLAAIERDAFARDLTDGDRAHHRRRVVQINRQMGAWS